jgi:hypothetical protein
MLVTFTDSKSKNSVAVNPQHVVAVFTVTEGEDTGKTVIGVLNGNLLVDESYITVVGVLQGELK